MSTFRDFPFKVYLGKTKGPYPERVYLTGFKWDCGWYYGGGYIQTRSMHTHFDGCFLEAVDVRGHSLGNFTSPWHKVEGAAIVSNGCSIWEPLEFFLNDAQFTPNEWWRIKDLYKQFYTIKQAAETFHSGGHCTSEGRNPAEINGELEDRMNQHLQDVVIPEIMKALKVEGGNP